ncbi:hypothetical protein [Sphingosinicella sp.]|uniref:hypothetical protein n=1 Tax=Sphingosinicella sp. TaxID=1917971 RepID=UPI0017C63A47|nr:hypothetical protein [Sphingosinicella sp.]MBA4759572.1 hypothetical protein [Sphingosinicella sp.]
MIRAAALAAILLFSPAAFADQTAVYKSKDGSQMTLEIADSGLVHVTGMAPGGSGIVRDGEFFLIFHHKGAVRVIRSTDWAAVMEKTIGARMRQIRERLGKSEAEPSPAPVIKHMGTARVAGFSGERYIVDRSDELGEDELEWVATRDPKFARVGAAWEKLMRSMRTVRSSLQGTAAANKQDMEIQLFALGTPLRTARYELVSMKAGKIDPARFVLPADPISRAQLLEEMTNPRIPHISIQ